MTVTQIRPGAWGAPGRSNTIVADGTRTVAPLKIVVQAAASSDGAEVVIDPSTPGEDDTRAFSNVADARAFAAKLHRLKTWPIVDRIAR